MNNIILKGVIRNIEYSHTINETEYDKADLIVKRDDGGDVAYCQLRMAFLDDGV